MALAKSSNRARSLTEIHLAVILFGLAGLFAKFVAAEPSMITLGRTIFASLALLLVIWWRRETLTLDSRRDYLRLAVTGVLLAVHWTTFFQAIRVSSVAVGIVAYSTFPIFAALIEPWMSREKTRTRDFMLAATTFMGASLVVPTFDAGNSVTQGMIWGLISAATFALLSVLNRSLAQRYPGHLIAFYQDAVAAVVLSPLIFIARPSLTLAELSLLVVLGVVFTALSHSLFIKGMKNVETRTASIIASLEPVYGIIFALLLLGEVPEIRTVVGGLVILGAAGLSSARRAVA